MEPSPATPVSSVSDTAAAGQQPQVPRRGPSMPAVERKIGLAAYSYLALDATMWRNADWAKRKGLYAELHPTLEGMDESISRLSNTLSHSSPEAIAELKKILWRGTEHWDSLLLERAAISGKLILSEFSKTAIQKFRAKAQN